MAARCGDGQVQAGVEGCDDGNDDEDDECVGCEPKLCGDAYLGPGELCDDGNECTQSSCEAETGCIYDPLVKPCDRRPRPSAGRWRCCCPMMLRRG